VGHVGTIPLKEKLASFERKSGASLTESPGRNRIVWAFQGERGNAGAPLASRSLPVTTPWVVLQVVQLNPLLDSNVGLCSNVCSTVQGEVPIQSPINGHYASVWVA
jgi:hypothetical protein